MTARCISSAVTCICSLLQHRSPRLDCALEAEITVEPAGCIAHIAQGRKDERQQGTRHRGPDRPHTHKGTTTCGCHVVFLYSPFGIATGQCTWCKAAAVRRSLSEAVRTLIDFTMRASTMVGARGRAPTSAITARSDPFRTCLLTVSCGEALL